MQLSPAQLAQIHDLLDEYHLLAAAVSDRHGALFLRNDAAVRNSRLNQVRRLRVQPHEVESFFDEIERFYRDLPYRSVSTDPYTPPAVEARLLLEGYTCRTELVLATDAALSGKPAEVEITAIETERHWRLMHDLLRQDEAYPGDADETVALDRLRARAFTWYLALADGKAVGHFSQMARDGLGYLERLFVRPEYRLRGIATALVHRAAADARKQGAGLVFLPTNADDTPKQMYASMGFEPVSLFRTYVKRP